MECLGARWAHRGFCHGSHTKRLYARAGGGGAPRIGARNWKHLGWRTRKKLAWIAGRVWRSACGTFPRELHVGWFFQENLCSASSGASTAAVKKEKTVGGWKGFKVAWEEVRKKRENTPRQKKLTFHFNFMLVLWRSDVLSGIDPDGREYF